MNETTLAPRVRSTIGIGEFLFDQGAELSRLFPLLGQAVEGLAHGAGAFTDLDLVDHDRVERMGKPAQGAAEGLTGLDVAANDFEHFERIVPGSSPSPSVPRALGRETPFSSGSRQLRRMNVRSFGLIDVGLVSSRCQ